MTSRAIAAALVAVAVLVGPAVADAEPYHDAAQHFTVDLPPGWRAMPNDRLDAIRSAVGIAYASGFEPSTRVPNQYPYVVTRFVPKAGGFATDEAAKSEATKLTNERLDEAKKRLASVVVNLSVEGVALEKDKGRVVIRTRMETLDRVTSGYTVAMIGANGLLYLGATARADEGLRPDVDALVSSFRWDAGHARRAEGSLFAWVGPPLIVLVIFAAGVALTKRAALSSARSACDGPKGPERRGAAR